MKNNWTKDWRKLAFAVGFGLTLGHKVGLLAYHLIDNGVSELLVKEAKKGNEVAQAMCKRVDLEYEEKHSESVVKNKIGFV